MISLIKKDFRAYGLMLIGILIIMLLYSYLCVRFGSIKGILGLLVIMLPAIVSIIVYIGDHELKYYLLSMPVTRKQIVLSKYSSTFIIGGAMISLTILIMYGLSFYYTDARAELEMIISFKGALFCITPTILIVTICYPLLFKYGLKIGVRIVMGGFALLYGFGMVITEKWIQNHYLVSGGGIFHAVMSLIRYYEPIYPIYYLVFFILLSSLIIVSIKLSVVFMGQKDII